MTTEGPIDLIRLEGAGGGVTVRITGGPAAPGPDGDGVLSGEILVETPFIRGRLVTPVLPEDIAAWQEALDTLDTGHGIGWRDDRDAAEVFIELDPEEHGRALVTVTDRSASETSATVPVELTDAWFDDAYLRLEQVRKAWPQTGV